MDESSKRAAGWVKENVSGTVGLSEQTIKPTPPD